MHDEGIILQMEIFDKLILPKIESYEVVPGAKLNILRTIPWACPAKLAKI